MTGRCSGIVLPALLALLAGLTPARSQDASTLKKEMIGQWELSTTERGKTCVVTLKGDASPQGLKLELEPGCGAALPFTRGHRRLEHQGSGYRAAAGCRGPAGDRFHRGRERDLRRPATGRGHLHPAESRRRALAGQIDGPDDRRLVDGARQGRGDLRPDADQHRSRPG